MSDPFATWTDLQDRWRTLSDAEQSRATVLLGDASSLLRALSPGIDDKISAGTLDAGVPKMVVCSMVKRQMQGPEDLDGVKQMSEARGPFSESFTFANPSGDLYLTNAEKNLLGIGVQRAFSVDLIPDDDSSSSSSSSS